MLVGMSLYGVEAWTRNADAFGVYFGLLRERSRRSPAATACSTRARRSSAPAARRAARGRRPCCSSGSASTAFDGASEGRCSTTCCPHLQDVLRRPRLRHRAPRWSSASSSGCSPSAARLADLVRSACAGMPRVDGAPARARARALADPDPRRLRRRALLLAARLQRPGPAGGSRPTRSATARDLFGGADSAIDYGVVSATAIWYVQVGALVTRARRRASCSPTTGRSPCTAAIGRRAARRSSCWSLWCSSRARPVAALGGERMTFRSSRMPATGSPSRLPGAAGPAGRRSRRGRLRDRRDGATSAET